MSSLPGALAPPRALLPGEKEREREVARFNVNPFPEKSTLFDHFFALIAAINSVNNLILLRES